MSRYDAFPAKDVIEVTPSDSANLAQPARAIYIGGNGNVTIVTPAGSEITINGALAGTVLPIQAVRIKSTGTTATNLLALI